jgi:Ca2+/Na+ antiporter
MLGIDELILVMFFMTGPVALGIISIVQIAKVTNQKRRAKPVLLLLGGIILVSSVIYLLMVKLSILFWFLGLATLIIGLYTVVFYGIQRMKHGAVQQTNSQI